ncbi:NUDIX domain-containing protein [Candidatus Uhrbacteria bacterium]|nr:NUDIX domain-containing protein [Candidatus Uhrbacteria bacterium]
MEATALVTPPFYPKHISAGTVLYRVSPVGDYRFLIMYRRKSGTWHLPKGTQRPEETLEETAMRETQDETGMTPKLEEFLGTVESTFERSGEPIQKETHYYLARLADEFSRIPDNEHDIRVFVHFHEADRFLREGTIYEEEWGVLEEAYARLLEREEK